MSSFILYSVSYFFSCLEFSVLQMEWNMGVKLISTVSVVLSILEMHPALW